MNEGLFALAALSWLAYLASRLLPNQVPELVAFLAVGAALGPSVTGVIDEDTLQQLEPVVEGALAVLMFVVGERVSARALKGSRWIVSAGALSYAFTAVAMYFAALYLGAGRPTALMLGAIAGAGAPMTVAALASSARARGKRVEGLLGTHAIADALAATVFAAVLPIAEFIAGPGNEIGNAMVRFARLGLGGLVLGLVLGWVIARLSQQIETTGELLLFVLVHLLLAQTASAALGLSLPLAAVVMGATVGTLSAREHSQRVFVVVRSIEQPLFLLFFALAGASMHLSELPRVGKLGAGYVIVRAVGKIVGGWAGGLLGGLDWRTSRRVGIDLLPQAGVAVGLAVLATEALPTSGGRVATIVLGSVVIFELAGSMIVAKGLRSAATTPDPADVGSPSSQGLPEHVLVASTSEVDLPDWLLAAVVRWGADVTVLSCAPDGEAADRIRDSEGGQGLSIRTISVERERFTRAIADAVRERGADFVVLLVPHAPAGMGSRLFLQPHERVLRELSVPVLVMPAGAPGAGSGARRS